MTKNVKSLPFNMIVNLIKTIFTTFFPLVVFKYVSYVLGQDGIGKVAFSNSIIYYFTIIAGLGISTYAIREGAKVRDNKEKLEKLGSQLFSLNIVSSGVSFILMCVLMIVSAKIREYSLLILIQSLSIFFSIIGVEWINIIEEDFLYITLRTAAIQILSFVLVIIFVRSKDDYIIYVLITTISTCLTNIINWFYIKKYVKIRVIFSNNIFRHLKPVIIIFFMNIAIAIYVQSDITILGYLMDDMSVGIYSVATKIYSCLKTILVATISVTIPRLSYALEKDEKEYITQLENIISISLFFCLPVVVGVCTVPQLMVLMISSKEYITAGSTIRILSLAIIPTMISTIINNNVLLAQRKEQYILLSTCVGSFTNVILNFILIPIIGINAAAITTIISEWVVFIICAFQARHTLRNMRGWNLFRDLLKSIIGILIILVLYYLFSSISELNIMVQIIYMCASVVMYFSIELLLKHRFYKFFFRNKST